MEPENKVLSFVTLSRYCVWRVVLLKTGREKTPSPGPEPYRWHFFCCVFFFFFSKAKEQHILGIKRICLMRVFIVWCIWWVNQLPQNIRSFLMGRLLMLPPWNWPFCCLFCAMATASGSFFDQKKTGKSQSFLGLFLMESRQPALLGAIGSRTGHDRCCPTNCLLENRF